MSDERGWVVLCPNVPGNKYIIDLTNHLIGENKLRDSWVVNTRNKSNDALQEAKFHFERYVFELVLSKSFDMTSQKLGSIIEASQTIGIAFPVPDILHECVYPVQDMYGDIYCKNGDLVFILRRLVALFLTRIIYMRLDPEEELEPKYPHAGG